MSTLDEYMPEMIFYRIVEIWMSKRYKGSIPFMSNAEQFRREKKIIILDLDPAEKYLEELARDLGNNGTHLEAYVVKPNRNRGYTELYESKERSILKTRFYGVWDWSSKILKTR